MANKTALFLHGIPTEPDVVTLNERFGVPVEGQPVSYEEIAAVLRVLPRSTRFKTVTWAWRKRLRADHRIILLARDGRFTVRDPSQRVMLGKTKATSGIKCFTEAVEIVVDTDRARLSEKEKADSDKVQRIASLASAAALAEARKRPVPRLRGVNEST